MTSPTRLFPVLALLCVCAYGQQGPDEIDQDFLGDVLGKLEERAPKQPSENQSDPGNASAADDNPLRVVDDQMMQAIQQLKIGNAGAITQQAQRRVLNVMRDLLSSSASPNRIDNPSQQTESQRPNTQEKPDQPNTGDSQPADNSGNSPGTDVGSSDEVVVGDKPPSIDGELIWGHLPERVRGEVLSTTPDQFLPRYRTAIIEYFRRLSLALETP